MFGFSKKRKSKIISVSEIQLSKSKVEAVEARIESLKQYQKLLCPINRGYNNAATTTRIHNPDLYNAIQEKINKIREKKIVVSVSE